MKIIYKIIISFYVIVLIIGLAGYFAVRESHEMIKNETGKMVESMTDITVRDMDTRISERINHFNEYITDSYLRESLAQSNAAYEQMGNALSYIRKMDKEWTSVPKGVITPFMKRLIDNDLSDLIRNKISFYNEVYNFKVYGEVFVTNKFGANVAQTGRTTDFRQDDEEWWQSAYRDGFYVRDVAYDESAGVYSTDVAIRIDDKQGKFAGVIKIVLNIEDTLAILRQLAVSGRYRDVHFVLTTRDGKAIYSSRGDLFFKDLSGEDFFKSVKGDSGYIIESSEGLANKSTVFAYARSMGFGWILFNEYNPEELFAPLIHLQRRLMYLSLVMVLMTLIVGYFIAKTISMPIEKLKNIAKAIGGGKLETKIDVRSNDEIGELAAVLGHMTDALKNIATLDHLTRAYNRKKLDEIMPMEMHRARRYSRHLAVAILDIDNFKNVNDVYGHSTGDVVLKTLAEIVKANLRNTSYFFRLGGEEFLIVVPETDINGIRILSERIRQIIEGYSFENVGTITVSFGVVQLENEDTVETLLKRADIALYQAKSSGKNRVCAMEWYQEGESNPHLDVPAGF